ncbi:tRNA1(Val) (adenine(37)-N6)-methyltransferase [Paramuribaculum intestinale]|uniref:tRNA1(Val) (adenine(37)-N6)-methyltransferase n=1 Tax=Paramuribaculum intestinale TaxID=2094151 RepID=UPI0025B783C4|nr:methyltransferase [Paramuribaculum intestinale]
MSRNPDRETVFRFKRFAVCNRECAMKVSTDSVLLGAWVSVDGVASAFDLGAGCGILSLMLCQRGVAHVTAMEIDVMAAVEAMGNAALSPWAGNIDIVVGDATSYSFDKVDLVITNPPYFDSPLVSPDKARAMARHQGSMNFQWIISSAPALLRRGGRLAMVTPFEASDEIEWLSSLHRMAVVRRCVVHTNPKRKGRRILWELAHDADTTSPVECEQLNIRTNSNQYTEEYVRLTSDFYIK